MKELFYWTRQQIEATRKKSMILMPALHAALNPPSTCKTIPLCNIFQKPTEHFYLFSYYLHRTTQQKRVSNQYSPVILYFELKNKNQESNKFVTCGKEFTKF